MEVITYDQNIHSLSLPKNAKYADLFQAVNRNVPCPNCEMCKLREKGGQLWKVDASGQGKKALDNLLDKLASVSLPTQTTLRKQFSISTFSKFNHGLLR